MIRKLVPALLLVATAPACGQPLISGISEERRIWVVRQGNNHNPEVYRCADGAPVDQPPKPVCIRAPLAREE